MGETHYEEGDIALTPVDFAPPTPPLHLSSFYTATQYGFCRFPVGWAGSWHHTPQRQLFSILAGTLEAQTSGGELRRFAAGSCFLLEDTTGKGHLTRVVGTTEVLSLVVQLPSEAPPGAREA
jgi:hypothetical protein